MADKKMNRLPSKKSHSWWWDSHISKKNSKWLAENLEVMDRSVKEMLNLIEEEGDSFAKKAEMYYQKRPELISHVEDFYRMYRALAERYDQVTGDLRRNIRSDCKSRVSRNGPDLALELPYLPEHTPESKQQHTDLQSRAAGFSVFLGSGGSSDVSRKGSDSSSSSDSESDSDDSDEKNRDTLHQRVLELEDELRKVTDKLRMQEEKCQYDHSREQQKYKSKITMLEEELFFRTKKLQDSQAEIMNLQEKLNESNASLEIVNVEISMKRNVVAELEEQVAVLQGDILGYKNEIEHLKEAAAAAGKQFETDRSVLVRQIEDYESELIKLKENFLQEKSALEAEIELQRHDNIDLKEEIDKIFKEKLSLEAWVSELNQVIKALKLSSASANEKLLKDKSALEAKITSLSESNSFLEAKIESMDGQAKQLEIERMEVSRESEKHISMLNQSLDSLKVKVDMLTAERDEFVAKVDSLVNDLKYRDDRICQMDRHLHHLHLEHVKLVNEIEEHKRTSSELKARVKELEDEVEKQKVVISDGAEGKREAIRQLCYSIEHYRDGYHQLRQFLQGHKRSPVMAT